MDKRLQGEIERLNLDPDIEPFGCRDPLLLRAIKARMFCAYTDPGTHFHDLGVQIKEWLDSQDCANRLYKGLSDPYPELRGLCGLVIITKRMQGFESIALRLLDDDSECVRGEICKALYGVTIVQCDQVLLRMAKNDPSYVVRGLACLALTQLAPEAAIPVLVDIMDNDTESEPGSLVPPPSELAAQALDEILGTSWVETRLENGASTFPPGPRDTERLKEQAILELKRRKP